MYGANHTLPFSEDQNVDHPVSLYAATKKANELIAHSYSHLYRLPTTGLRFFTVYGPWGRPDMAPMLFTKAILAGHPIRVFNDGKHAPRLHVCGRHRGRHRAGAGQAARGRRRQRAPYAIYNIGNHDAVELETFIATLERLLGRTAIREYAPMQPGDVPATYAAIDRLAAVTGFAPHTPLADGLARFVAVVSRVSHDSRAARQFSSPAAPGSSAPISCSTGWTHGRAGRQPRQAHLRRQPRQPRGAARRRAAPLRARRHRRPRAGRRAAGAAPAARDRQFRGREPRRPLDPRPGGVRRDQRRRHVPSARGGARLLGGAAASEARGHSASCTSRPTRSTARSARTIAAFTRDDAPTRRTVPYSASKAASDHLVRAYHHTYGLPTLTTNCSNNYGPFQFPEKLIPLMIVNALAGKPLPVYGDGRNVRDWLYVGDHCAAIRAVLAGGAAGRDVQHRRQRRDDQPRRRRHDLPDPGRARARAATTRASSRFVKDRPGHDRRYAIDAAQDPPRAGLGARGDRSRPGCAGRCAGTSTTATGSRAVTSGEYQQMDLAQLRRGPQ